MLNQKQVEEYRKALEARRSTLTTEISTGSQPVDFGGDTVQPGEEKADETEELLNQLAISDTLRKEVQEIDDALERIRKGEYGVCKKCGQEISPEVLNAAMESALCESCKLAEEV